VCAATLTPASAESLTAKSRNHFAALIHERNHRTRDDRTGIALKENAQV
jgi:hypothetical protein